MLDVEDDRSHGQDPVAQLVERPVEEQATVVDDDDPLAERLDVGEVVRRQEDRRPVAAVDLLQELADVRLGDDVEADRRLVEEEERRPVEERGGEVAAHPLAEGELADGLAGGRP